MQGKPLIRIFTASILLVVVISSNAYGNHLDSDAPHPGPPKIHQPKQIRKPVTIIRKTPATSSQVISNQAPPSPTEPPPLTTAAEQKKHSPKSHAKSGWRFLLNEQPQAAMAAYKQALRQNPKSANAYLGLGISLKHLGKVGLAKKALLKAININPRLPSALVHLGYLYAEGHLGQTDLLTARRLFHQASQLGDPFAPIALLDMKSRQKL